MAIAIGIGQAGCAIALEFSELANTLLLPATSQSKFQLILLDCEGKTTAHPMFSHHTRIISKERGHVGGVWANGYHNGGGLLTKALSAVRERLERSDGKSCFSGFLIFMGLSGGTGSGLGSLLVEALRAQYATNYICCVTVAPFRGGESPLQDYNSILALSKLQPLSDMIIEFRNDDVMAEANANAMSTNHQKKETCSFASMNIYIARCLCSSILPLLKFIPPINCNYNLATIPIEFWQTISQVSPDRATNIVENHCIFGQKIVPSVNFSDLCAKKICDGVAAFDGNSRAIMCLSGQAIVREFEGKIPYEQERNHLSKRLCSVFRPVTYNPFVWDIRWGKSTSKASSSVSVLANTSRVIHSLSHTLTKAQNKAKTNAFLHWYEQSDCSLKDFEVAFDAVEDVIYSYNSASTVNDRY